MTTTAKPSEAILSSSLFPDNLSFSFRFFHLTSFGLRITGAEIFSSMVLGAARWLFLRSQRLIGIHNQPGQGAENAETGSHKK